MPCRRAGSPTKRKDTLHHKKWKITCSEQGEIFFDNKLLNKYPEDVIIYTSKYNTIIEDSTALLLFIVLAAGPDKDRIEAFRVTANKATKLVEAIASKISDFDNDGFLEFGGFGLTEVYPNKDSMYYIPTAYYEIKKGAIHFDALLTKKKDIELNGIYLKSQLDKDGNCCRVIKKPKHKKLSIMYEK